MEGSATQERQGGGKMPPGLTNAEQSGRTQRALLDAARELFAEQGYSATTNEEIVRRAKG